MNTIDERPLDAYTGSTCWSIMENTPTINMCRRTLFSNLFKNGFELTTIGKEKKNSEKEFLQHSMNNGWMEFAYDFISYVLAIGVVPVQINDNKDGSFTPSVVPWLGQHNNALRMTTFLKNNKQQFKVYSTSESVVKEMENVVVFDGFGYNPDLSGTIKSTISTLIPIVGTIEILTTNMLTAEKIRTNPPIMTETVETKTTAPAEGVEFDHYCNADMLEATAENTFFRDETSIAQLNNQKKIYMDYFNPKSADPENEQKQKLLDAVLPLPLGQKIGRQQMPESRSDYILIIDHLKDEMFNSLGVPRSMFLTTGIGKNSDNALRLFMDTVLWWREHLTKKFSIIYQMIYGDDEIKNILGKRRRKTEVSDNELFLLKSKYSTIVTLPVQTTSDEKLKMLYDEGVISYETYAKNLLLNNNLSLYDFDGSEPAPRRFEEQKKKEVKDQNDKKKIKI